MNKIIALPFLAFIMGAVPPPSALQQARTASNALLSELQTTLKSTLSNQGPTEAVKICHQLAPGIAQSLSEKMQLQVRRVSLKARSQQGKPDAYEQKQLQQWAMQSKLIPEEKYEVVTERGKQVLRYMKPIRIQAVCLQCHGQVQQIKPEIKAMLQKYYPQDQATGYQEGDLRGAVIVIVPLTIKQNQ